MGHTAYGSIKKARFGGLFYGLVERRFTKISTMGWCAP
jgi:hypothetical protein